MRTAITTVLAVAVCHGLTVGLMAQAAKTAPAASKGYQQNNLISNGAVDAPTINQSFVNPWGVSIGPDFWINTTGTGLDDVVTSAGDAISFHVTIPPAKGTGTGSPTGTVYMDPNIVPAGEFALPDKSSPAFLFCSIDGTISGWSSGDSAVIAVKSAAGDEYTGIALLKNAKGAYVLVANAGAAADVQAFDGSWKRAMPAGFKDPNMPANYAPFGVHVIGGNVYVTYAPRSSASHKPTEGVGFVDQFDETGKLVSRVIPTGGMLFNPWGMALAPSTFGKFGGDFLVGNVGDGSIAAYDSKWTFKGKIADENGNPILNPGLWEIVFGMGSAGAGDPNTLYIAAGLEGETGGIFAAITPASSKVAHTTTSVSSDGNPDSIGAAVTFTALVEPKSGFGEPEGKVSFTVDGKLLATAELDSTAHAMAKTNKLALGKHSVKAIYSGDANFLASTGTLTETVAPPAAAAPIISPAAGSYSAAKTVSITDRTPHATIYYTTDGSMPTAKSHVYSKPWSVSSNTTVRAMAWASGFADSAVTSVTYTISLGATAAPTFTPAQGSFGAAQTVTLADTSAGAKIYYTTDGSAPTAKSTLYSKGIPVSATTKIGAIAVATGLQPSAVTWATFTITTPTATPKFSPAAGTYSASQTVSITDTTGGAKIYYTTDGSMPTTSSPVYSKAISVAATMTINAIAIAPGSAQSTEASAYYKIGSTGGGW